MSRRFVVALVCAAVLCTVSTRAAAQERAALDLSSAVSTAVLVPPGVPLAPLPVTFTADVRTPGPSPLMTSLYASTAVMQALDVHSTLLALDRGAVEQNPVMSGISRNKGAFIALKAGVALSTVMAARNMSKRNKGAAVVTLVAINSAYALVVRHNYRVAAGR